MHIAVTVRFQNSYFSGSVPQVACAYARALAAAGHDVTLVYPKGETAWFIELDEYKAMLPPRKEFSASDKYDVVLEVAWALKPEERRFAAPRRISLVHYPPVFHDMESCVYSWNTNQRDFSDLTELWTYDFYNKTDVRYLEFLSGGLPVSTVPYIWDPTPLDMFVAKEGIRSWNDSASAIEAMVPKDAPHSLSWCARIVESNFSNTSHCILPLNIVSEIRKRVAPIRFTVHNGEAVGKHPFFLNNIAKNLLLPDLSGNMLPRVRLPELRREKTFFVAHGRFRPLKSYLLDALYLGFPMIHNNQIIKSYGAPYYYELNQITQAADAFAAMEADYKAGKGFFAPAAAETRRKILSARFSPQSNAAALRAVMEKAPPPVRLTPPAAQQLKQIVGNAESGELRVAFAHMWDDFQPRHNFFMYLLGWIGAQHGIKVSLDETAPNLVFFGPWSAGSERKWAGVPKVFFTGENTPPNTDADTFLNIGFAYNTDPSYVRLPLWVLEVNWWGADVEKIVNPKPVSVDAATIPLKTARNKFCTFVATNPANGNRNAAFHVLNQWRGVEAGGRLFCNRAGGPIPAGRGGGGGELAKVDYYKDFKFVITFENSSAPGYTTEKLFHAKVAGAVPIYWGDPFVDRDFDARGFINANGIKTPQDLVELVQKVTDNQAAYDAMTAIPAVTEFKRRWCERTMEHAAAKIFKRVLGQDIKLSQGAWATAQSYGRVYEVQNSSVPTANCMAAEPAGELAPLPEKRVLVSACNAKYAEAAVNLFASMRAADKDCKRILYVWPDVPEKLYPIFQKNGVDEIRILPTTEASVSPWQDFWEPQHFAWKLWIHNNLLREADADTCYLVLDAGTVISSSPEKIWRIINTHGVFLLDDPTQKNERWCHEDFIKAMNVTHQELQGNQTLGGLVGFKGDGPFKSVATAALIAAKNRSTIVGEKWHRYSDVCFGHRHDQSILSVLSQRAALPRQPLNDYYCDVSMRAAKQFGTPLYVHRGTFKEFEPFTQGIDEAYVINLARRKDRLDKFKVAHTELKDKVYVLPAVDGKQLALTPELAQCFRDNDFKWKKAVMGCALSHLTLWEKLANDSVAKSYLIMEDDVNFNAGWLQAWNRIASSAPPDADVIYLGGILPPNMPAFPTIIEPVNAHFARVKKNTLFGGAPRRYFHFCNYSYLLTQSGARKIVKLIKERGIFTSGDHMIVNHGDDLLNIYFTTPLLAKCIQEDDPAYVTSVFNDFSRIDKFDSDLWNNNEYFSAEEVALASSPAPMPVQVDNDESTTLIWNKFLRDIALHNSDDIKAGIQAVFDIWSRTSVEEIAKKLSWFRIFEQLLLSRNADLMPHVPLILDAIQTRFPPPLHTLWDKVQKTFGGKPTQSGPGVHFITDLPKNAIKAWHMEEITPSFHECNWLDCAFPKPLEYSKFNSLNTLLEAEGTPLVIYQKIPGMDVSSLFKMFVSKFAEAGKQMILLHLSDEFANDDISIYDSPAVKAVIRNYWRPLLPAKAILIPLGYASGRSAKYLPPPPPFSERKNIFAFCGSLDRPGRTKALETLKKLEPHACTVRSTWSDKEPLAGPEYNALLRTAKFVPCFRGSKALESFRVYEALEHGAIPIYVAAESTDGTEDEFKAQFGPNPLLGFPSWSTAATLLPNLAEKTDVMEKHRQGLMAWWAEKKAATAQRIDALF